MRVWLRLRLEYVDREGIRRQQQRISGAGTRFSGTQDCPVLLKRLEPSWIAPVPVLRYKVLAVVLRSKVLVVVGIYFDT